MSRAQAGQEGREAPINRVGIAFARGLYEVRKSISGHRFYYGALPDVRQAAVLYDRMTIELLEGEEAR
jgi:hypothetical protein